MDAFTTIDCSLDVLTEETTSLAAPSSQGDVMQELIDADTRMGYGGYCVVA